MLDETYHCDGPGCEKTTPKKNVSPVWRVVLWLQARDSQNTTGDKREWHYCSRECEHMASSPEDESVTEPHPYTAIRKQEE